MTEKIEVGDLYPLQAKLDEEIHQLHHVDYESTHSRRVLALLVELGEFANETRCFKYWSLKGPSPKEVVLDEYADGLHFFLSLGIPLGMKGFSVGLAGEQGPLYDRILEVYEAVSRFAKEGTEENYRKAFSLYLRLIPLFGANGEEVKSAYLKKLGVNYKRQEEKY